MSFYWITQIPNVSIAIEDLEKLVFDRYTKLRSHHDSLLEGGDDDLLTHWMLCVIANQLPTYRLEIIQGEVDLFTRRLGNMSSERVVASLTEIQQDLQEYRSSRQLQGPALYRTENTKQLVIRILKTIADRADHVFDSNHSTTCRKSKLKLPFTFALAMLAAREVTVLEGKANIYCGQWRQLLAEVFHHVLTMELDMIQQSTNVKYMLDECEDDRIRQIVVRFDEHFKVRSGKGRMLQEDELDDESSLFPPCMANLHQILRRTHRLSYESSFSPFLKHLQPVTDAVEILFISTLRQYFSESEKLSNKKRYHYTLFLKDINLSVDENVKLWKEEYSQPSHLAQCSHEWQEKEGRYTYQIKHLYGLIGTHEEKTSHKCDKFIGHLGLKMNSGCPFQHNSIQQLKKGIPIELQQLEDIEDLYRHKEEGDSRKCCAVYFRLQGKYREVEEEKLEGVQRINSPLEFYQLAKTIFNGS